MALVVTVVGSGGIAATEVANGVPVSPSADGSGIPITLTADGSGLPVTGSSVTFAQDNFPGSVNTSVNGQAMQVGGPWAAQTGAGAATATFVKEDATGGCFCSGNVTGGIAAIVKPSSGHPPSANYAVTADMKVVTVVVGDVAEVLARTPATTASGYGFGYHGSIGKWAIASWVSGSPTILASSSAVTLNAGQTYALKLVVSGSTLTGYVDGAQVLQVTDTTYSAAGDAGLLFSNTGGDAASTGVHLRNFVAKT